MLIPSVIPSWSSSLMSQSLQLSHTHSRSVSILPFQSFEMSPPQGVYLCLDELNFVLFVCVCACVCMVVCSRAFGMCVCVRAGAGADFVMMGGMLAGHDQCAGEVIEKDGKKFKLFYGMSSDVAMKKYVGGVAEYRWLTPALASRNPLKELHYPPLV